MNDQELVKEIDAALDAHAAWKKRLLKAIREGQNEVPPDKICVDDQCVFGKWLYGPSIDATTRLGRPYQVIQRLHAEFHTIAAEVARMVEAGRRGDAYTLLEGEYAVRSDKLTRALTKWRHEA